MHHVFFVGGLFSFSSCVFFLILPVKVFANSRLKRTQVLAMTFISKCHISKTARPDMSQFFLPAAKRKQRRENTNGYMFKTKAIRPGLRELKVAS